MDQVAKQREYYRQTADNYDDMQGGDAAHQFALPFLIALVDQMGAKTVLDVGSGTGRVPLALQTSRPDIQTIGVEPVAELREVGHKKGLSKLSLSDGDAYSLPFPDNAIDIVCAFGVMHHLADPDRAALEMVRVARLAIFISDHNDCGRGSTVSTTLKRLVKRVGLWSVYKFAITRGKGYRETDDDGIWYPYTILDTHKTIRSHFSGMHFINTTPSGPDMRKASHVVLIGQR